MATAINLPPVPRGSAWNPATTPPPAGSYEFQLRNGLASRGTVIGKTVTIANYMGTVNMRIQLHMLPSFVAGWRV